MIPRLGTETVRGYRKLYRAMQTAHPEWTREQINRFIRKHGQVPNPALYERVWKQRRMP